MCLPSSKKSLQRPHQSDGPIEVTALKLSVPVNAWTSPNASCIDWSLSNVWSLGWRTSVRFGVWLA